MSLKSYKTYTTATANTRRGWSFFYSKTWAAGFGYWSSIG